MNYDIIEHMDTVQEEITKLSIEEDILAFAVNVVDYLESRDKTLNEDIGKALIAFFKTLPKSVAKKLWFVALDKKRIKKALIQGQDDKSFVELIKGLFI